MGHMASSAFSLVELLVVIAILAVLMALILSGVTAVRESSRRASANATLAILTVAVTSYRDEDPQRRFPTAAIDGLVRADDPATPAASMASLINPGERDDASAPGAVRRDLGLQRFVSDPAISGKRLLVDPWGRPYRYRTDQNLDGNATKPAPLPSWNPKGHDSYAYLWSLGRPRLGATDTLDATDPDADPAGAERWLTTGSGR
jgi:prepilin-type N-terminal cleavage/methylation domain-containing protein